MTVKILHSQGYSKKRIARELKVSINTVRKYLSLADEPRYKLRPPRGSKLEQYHDYLQSRVNTCSAHRLPATVLLDEIRTQGYTGSLSLLRQYLYKQRVGHQPKEAVVRFETQAGEQMQVDWAKCHYKGHRCSAFIATLGYSRASYVEFVSNEQLATLIACHESAFSYFGGVPKTVLYDNMKTVILERNYYSDGKHRFTPGFWDFAKHYHFVPKVCRPYRAQTKGKVERFIHYLKHSFYYPYLSQASHNTQTLELGTLNAKVLSWLTHQANERIHATLQEKPNTRLIQEQAALQLLPLPYTGCCVRSVSESRGPFVSQSQSTYLSTTVQQHECTLYDFLLNDLQEG